MSKAKRGKHGAGSGEENAKVISSAGMPGVRVRYVVCALLVLVTLAVYWQVVGYEFLRMDDSVYVVANDHVRSGLTRGSILWSITGRGVSNWHPLTWLSLMTDYQIGGLHPRVFHITNIVLHLANVLLLVLVSSRHYRVVLAQCICGSAFCAPPATRRVGGLDK